MSNKHLRLRWSQHHRRTCMKVAPSTLIYWYLVVVVYLNVIHLVWLIAKCHHNQKYQNFHFFQIIKFLTRKLNFKFLKKINLNLFFYYLINIMLTKTKKSVRFVNKENFKTKKRNFTKELFKMK